MANRGRLSPISLVVLALVSVYVFGPLYVMVLESLAEVWYRGRQWWFPQRVSLKWYEFIFRDPDVFRAIWLTFVIAVTVSAFTIALCLLPAYVVGTGRIKRLKEILEASGSIPQTIPAVAMGVGLLPVYHIVGLLYSFHGVVFAHSIGAIPYVFRNLVRGFSSMDPSLEEAARSLGARRLTVIRRIYLPLLKPYVAAAAVLAFAWSINEFVLTMLLGFPQITNIAVKVYQNAGGYYWSPHLAGALSTILIVPSLLIMLLIERATGVRLETV